MISPLELMRNSIVCFEGRAYKVKSVSELIMLEGRKEWIGGSLINGEPISEVWMEKLGWELVDTDSWEYKKGDKLGMRIHKSLDGIWLVYFFTGNWEQIRTIEFVHQLQGFYFFTTGKYLIVPKTIK